MEPTTPTMGMSRPGQGLGRVERQAVSTEPNRGQRRRLEAQQRAEQKRQERVKDAVQLRISQGLDLLRHVMSRRLDIPTEHLGLIIENGAARGYDVRKGSLVSSAEEAAPAAAEEAPTLEVVDDLDEEGYAWGRRPR